MIPENFRKMKNPVVFGLKLSDAKEWLFISGTVPRDKNNVVVGKNDIKKQIAKVFGNLKDILKAGGATFKNLVQLNVYITDTRFRSPYLNVSRKIFKNIAIAQTILVVKGLNDPDVLIEIDGIACIR